ENRSATAGGAAGPAMIGGLDHINVETTDLDSSIRFYEQVLGLTVGWRPSFDVPGAWMYVNDDPIVHLVLRDEINDGPTGAIHHVALKASGYAEARRRLEAEGLTFDVKVVPDLSVTQVFVDDPNGVKLELNFYEDSVS
ncbi:MAG: VOC family protein, partial [Pseudomonadota bacterium]